LTPSAPWGSGDQRKYQKGDADAFSRLYGETIALMIWPPNGRMAVRDCLES
jgi:hypothetical protein